MCVFLLSYAFSPVLAVSQFCIDVMVADQVTPFLGHLCNKQITSLHFFFPLITLYSSDLFERHNSGVGQGC